MTGMVSPMTRRTSLTAVLLHRLDSGRSEVQWKKSGGVPRSEYINRPSFGTLSQKGGGFLRKKWKYALAGGLAGVANGLFGGGGGSVLVPLLTGYCRLDQRKAFATSVAVILPLCALSVVIYLFRGGLDLVTALPYLVGGAAGGWAGGKWFKGVKMPWLRRAFGLLLIYGGVRSFL